ncbi:MAG TPA: cyclic pyranopterin monophosphate synthase MoaC [Desulfurococcales archaeon]|nr:cyclic pyranopterin monophosphate synthase MoaC [Desulfurococcales archaeon]
MSVRMVDVTSKPEVYREAIAEGKIRLRRETLELIRSGRVEKGDVLTASQVAAILAVKRTPDIIPLCHPIPITHIAVDWFYGEDYLGVRVKVKTTAKTGAEMEALTGVLVALLNVWDMVKKYEKDEKGEYPNTLIYDVRVIRKFKQGG